MPVRIPLKQGVASAGQLGGRVNTSTGSAVANAGANLGQVVSDIGKSHFGMEVEVKRMENARTLSEMKRKLREEEENFQNELLTDHDPATWLDRYRERMSGARGGLGINALPPEAREQWDKWESDYRSQSELRVSRDASLYAVRRSKEALSGNTDYYFKNGQYAEGYEAIQDAEEQGIVSPEQALKMMRWGESLEQEDLHNQELEANPERYLASLQHKGEDGQYKNYGDKSNQWRRTRIERAKSLLNRRKREELSHVKGMIEAGDLEDPEKLDNLQLHYLNDRDKKALKRHLNNQADATWEDVHAGMILIDRLKNAKGKVSDSEYSRMFFEAERYVTSHTRRGSNGWLKQRLNYINPNYQAGAGDNLLKKGRGRLMEDAWATIKVLEKKGAFGEVKNDDDETIYDEKRGQQMRDLMNGFEDWLLEQDREVPVEEARKKLGSMISTEKAKEKYREVREGGEWKPLEPATRLDSSDLDTNLESMSAGLLPSLGRPINDLPARRGKVQDGWAVGTASTYGFKGDKFEENHTYGGMNSVNMKRGTEPWWKEQGLPTIALAPETAKAMGLTLPKKKNGKWDISQSKLEVDLGNGKVVQAVYAENGMYNPKYPNSHNKLIDLSEQFQQKAKIKGGTNYNIKIRPLK